MKKEPPNFGLLIGNWGYLTSDTNQTLFTHQVKDILESPAPLLLMQEVSQTVLTHVQRGCAPDPDVKVRNTVKEEAKGKDPSF